MRRKRQYYRPYEGRRKPAWLLALLAVILVLALGFVVLLGLVLTGARDSVTGQPQVMVILGCKVESWGPSVLLQDRLDKALDYLEDHPDLTIVVSGGQGPDEHQSEAQCMFDYLTDHGVDGDQILLEDRSHNTWENIRFTQELLEQESVDASQVVVVSNGFHLTRVRMLWGRVWEGEYTLSTLAAPSSHVPSRLKMYIREPLALVKSYFFDR
ncbi:YdcF family protein [uncultured Flavonifractor sp.]|uniref:YdcF family protein n=1 Tax=uncultured Flavonifractor sp. TaxID=1193534 RepID=UPI002607DC1A|nr:YdcF family protein [uncultured Flavonifractor sp.]